MGKVFNNYIGGNWVASVSEKTFDNIHPANTDEKIGAGLITVNLPTAGVEYQLPFGGTKESSFGMREQGPSALDIYTETRTVYFKYYAGTPRSLGSARNRELR